MSEPMKIADGKVVVMHYTLRTSAGETLDTSEGDEPMAYLHGAQNIVPGLEKALTGKAAGFKGQVVVEPAQGYGERVEAPPQAVPRAAFPAEMELEPGMQFVAEGPDGSHVPIWVLGEKDGKVLVESQHPLAGAHLHFDVQVVDVRDASADEVAHGHPHGPDGHGHHH